MGTAQIDRPEELLLGVLAVLAQRGVDTIRTNDRAFHSGFGAALAVFRESGGQLSNIASYYYADPVSNAYAELDQAVIAAEQFNLVRFPNPSYSRLQLTITPRVAAGLLKRWGETERGTFDRAADALLETMQNA